jgi:hypothetical protein
MENKQTAVDFLIEVMQRRLPPFYAHFMMDMDSVYDQAKAMEKEQIIDAWKNAEGYNDLTNENLAEQYYNETYGRK